MESKSKDLGSASPLAGEVERSSGEGYKKIAHRKYPPYIKNFARDLRKNSTDVEGKLWSRIRNKNLDVKFRRQHQIGSKYIADFVCLEKRLIIELDGGQHCENENDKIRTLYLEKHNFRVIRIWNNEILENLNGCLEFILEELNTPHPK